MVGVSFPLLLSVRRTSVVLFLTGEVQDARLYISRFLTILRLHNHSLQGDAGLKRGTTTWQGMAAFVGGAYLEHPLGLAWWDRNEVLIAVTILAALSALWALALWRRLRNQSALLREWARREVTLKEKYEELFENANDIVFTVDLQGNLTSINAAAERLIGLNRLEALGTEALQYVAPEYRDQARATLEQKLRDGGASTSYLEVCAKDGRRVPLEVSSRVIFVDGRAAGVQGIARDITERTQAEAAIKRSEEHIRLILQSAAEGIYGLDLNGNCTFCNAAAVRLLGYTDSSDVLGKKMHVLVHHTRPDGAPYPAEECRIYAAYRQGEGTHDETEVFWRRDGSSFPVEYWSYPIVQDRKVVGSVVSFMDVHERKQAEERLKLFKHIFANTTDAVAVFDPRGRLIEQNAAQRALLGFSDQELQGRNAAAVLGDELFCRIRKVLGNSNSFRGEASVRRCSGESVHADLSMINILDDRRRVLCQVLLMHDITARKRTEEEHRRAREAAEAASRAKGEFLANMSHEIRTPLNDVLGMAELALLTNLNDEQREYLNMVKASGENLLTVINDILDFSKIEAGRLELNALEFDLRDMLGETLKMLSLRSNQKGLELALHVASEVPDRLEGDSARLRQVIVNLVSNAIKFTEQGEVALHVSLETGDTDSLWVRFRVTDTGMGIPPEKHRLIFAPFTQADSSTTRRHGGTGLGLAICLQLVELMGGRLWMESEVGRGSSFYFTARFRVAKSKPETSGPGRDVRLEGLDILVIDDNATVRSLLGEMLTAWGMKTSMADGGRRGLEALNEATKSGKPFRVALIDSQMPDLDGFTVAERIRQGQSPHSAVVMMLPSLGLGCNMARCRELGVSTCIYKPIKEGELFEAVLAVVTQDFGDGNTAGKIAGVIVSEECTPPPIDWDYGLAQADGDLELFHDLLKLFVREAPGMLNRIRQAVRQKDSQGIVQGAHALKGSVSNFGASQAVKLAAGLERMGRVNDLEHVEKAVKELEEEVSKVVSSIEARNNGVS